jgi:hypothetical protein
MAKNFRLYTGKVIGLEYRLCMSYKVLKIEEAVQAAHEHWEIVSMY